MLRPKRSFAIFAAAAAALTACVNRTNFRQAAESFIEDASQDVATQLSVTFADAVCLEPINEELGTTFECGAIGSDNATYNFIVEITGDRTFVVRPGAAPIPGTVPPATTVPAVPATTVPAGTAPPATAAPATAAPATAPPTTPPAS